MEHLGAGKSVAIGIEINNLGRSRFAIEQSIEQAKEHLKARIDGEYPKCVGCSNRKVVIDTADRIMSPKQEVRAIVKCMASGCHHDTKVGSGGSSIGGTGAGKAWPPIIPKFEDATVGASPRVPSAEDLVRKELAELKLTHTKLQKEFAEKAVKQAAAEVEIHRLNEQLKIAHRLSEDMKFRLEKLESIVPCFEPSEMALKEGQNNDLPATPGAGSW